jgi:phosphotransferase system enzyme I (PtsI)
LIDDPDLQKEVSKRIRKQMQDVQSVVGSVIKDYSNFFRNLPDPQFQGKAIDIMDVGKRILKNCQKRQSHGNNLEELHDGVIIIAEDLTPSEIVGFNPARIRGIAIEEGTPTSHASILARSLGIPALIQVKDLMRKANNGHYAIIDSSSGQLFLNPDEGLRRKYADELELFSEKQRRIFEILSEPSITTDQVEIELKANIGQLSDLDAVAANRACGVGLYRTEFAYLTRRTFPTEAELYDSYVSVVDKLGDSSLVIRTIDIGGDKISHLMGNAMERNPELGWRAVRMALDCEEVFSTQLKAILRAAAHGKPGQVGILFPMISNIEELRKIKNLLNRMHEELIQEGKPAPQNIRIGIMVEIPSVALLAEKFAKEVDFFSIGSNDLVQYTLAVDRTNSKVSHLYQPANPAVIKLISHVVKVARQFDVGVSLCGEMAGDIRYTVLLLGLGLKELSMNAILIPAVKQVVRSVSFAEAERLISPVLGLDTADEIEHALEKINQKLGLQ